MIMGIGSAAGIGYAQAMLWTPLLTNEYIPRKCATPALEVDRFEAARRSLLSKTNELRNKAVRIVGDEDAAIFDAYSMVLDDEDSLLEPLRKLIRHRHYTAEHAVSIQFSKLAREFLQLEDEYMRQRADDVFNLREQLMRELMGQHHIEMPKLTRPTVVVAQMLGPGDIANMDLVWLEGIICENGGYSSHTAIIARNLGIPAIMGVKNITTLINNGQLVALDGETGEVWVEPSDQQVDELHSRSVDLAQRTQATLVFRGRPTISLDGHRIELAASISRLEETERVASSDAESLGMFRTEWMIQSFQSEDEQYNNYCELLKKMRGKPVTVRTFDDGGNPSDLKKKPEENPVLGCHGIRLSIARPSMFRTQLRALLRASANGPLRILFPMISTHDELSQALYALNHVKMELEREEIPYNNNLPVGAYITIPGAALLADVLAEEVDFITVGVNDLIQFTMAVERNNSDLNSHYHLYHPAMLRLLQHVVKCSHGKGKPCYLSGDPPGFEHVLPLLMGMEFDGLILNPGMVLRSRQILCSCHFSDCQRRTEELLKIGNSAELTRQAKRHFDTTLKSSAWQETAHKS